MFSSAEKTASKHQKQNTMKRFIVALAVLGLCIPSFALDNTNITFNPKTTVSAQPSSASTNTHFEGSMDSLITEEIVPEKEKKGNSNIAHWGGFEMGVSGLLNKNGGLELENGLYDLDYSSSISYNLNLFETKINLFSGHAGIITGLGFNWNNYAFKGNTTLSANNDGTVAVDQPGLTFSKNKLRATYVKIPVLLEFNTSLQSSKSFHIAGGVEGGFKLRSKTIQEYELEGEKYDVDAKGHYNVNPWKLNAVGRIGYKNFTLFANYGLTTLFEKDKGPEMYPFEVGITIIGF